MSLEAPKTNRLERATALVLLLLLLNTAYVAAFAEASIFYMGNAALHLALGLAFAVLGALLWQRRADLRRPLAPAAGFFAVAVLAALYLLAFHNVRAHRWALWLHVAAAGLGVVALLFALARKLAAPSSGLFGPSGLLRFRRALLGAALLALLVPSGAALVRRLRPDPSLRIVNPTLVPVAMTEEGGGPKSPFFPSSAQTNVGGIIPSNFFMDSATCGECHKDIYRQWQSSAHRFGSFNNQFYRKSIEYMQDVVGTRPSKWCAGCHDHAVFFNGRFERPIKDQIDTPEAHAGLGCMSCHAITHVGSSMGNGDFTIEYPPLHELASSKNPFVRGADKFLTYLDPEPHRRTFMKPFMRADTAEFCASCHKVHLDVPVNSYRWVRGFNDYDNWQASAVSGQGARSFYYPPEAKTCAGCHMPLVDSRDPGNRDGQVHSHRFPAANTALPFVNRDAEQLDVVTKFLQSGFITVDLFAITPAAEPLAGEAMVRRGDEAPQAMSTFAVGEEAESGGETTLRQVSAFAAPLESAGARIVPGQTVRVDAVVRTRAIGHFFPGGTVDAFDVWLELEAKDATGRVLFWSGRVEDGGRGPVEKGAHFYRSFALDAEGNPIDKRNAWQARSALYTRLIPPGAADTVHFRVHVPADARGPITLTARLNYRKFSRYYTEFSYAGQPKPGQSPKLLSPHFNSLDYSFDPKNVPANVSGQIKGAIPDLPIIELARDEATVPLAPPGSAPAFAAKPLREDRERWNDWGIGLLLQGDLKGAERAFRTVTEIDPDYADGWVNVARALVREGETEAARPFVEQALARSPKLGRALFFRAMIEKAAGDYAQAEASLRAVVAQYPRDRVVLNQLARVLFLERRHKEALAVLEQVCLVDPEDVQMHYTAMLAARALGDSARAAREAQLFRRFKAEESSQAITGPRRRLSPEDNNERQSIHEHESAPLPPEKALPAAPIAAAAGG
ncbi:MAG TPA: tetratricopeptide repeat protein [Thermoanaerobaculia bacterium]|nr:tetratricopeptide repeat protein [Thermoanaerobaculia bacterium]